MREAFLLLLIFGAALLLAAARLLYARDPRKSIFLSRVPGAEKMTIEKARKTSREIGIAVAGVGMAVVVYCVIGLIRGV